MYDDIKARVMEGTMLMYEKYGVKFTMDQLSDEIKMSKKTIYKVFIDKKDLMMYFVDYIFNQIKQEERKIIQNDELSTYEKVKGVLACLPEGLRKMDMTQLYMIKNKYPKCAERVYERIESDWEYTYDLIQKGVNEGIFKEFDFRVFKIAYQSTLEAMLSNDVLNKEGVSYQKALDSLVDILLQGISK